MKPKVFVHVQSGYFDCIILKGGNVLLCNSYSFNTPEDFIYFILFSFEQLKLNPNEVETNLCGNVDEKSALFEILFTYIRNVSMYQGKLQDLPNTYDHEQLILKASL